MNISTGTAISSVSCDLQGGTTSVSCQGFQTRNEALPPRSFSLRNVLSTSKSSGDYNT